MRIFKGNAPERDIGSFMAAMAEGDVDWDDTLELDRLGNMLSRRNIRFEKASHGPFSGLRFDSPHGKVSVVFGPATLGSSDGLLEAYCSGWDMSPRGFMTANDIVSGYLHGGW